jgi:hypothetical protein
MDAQSEPTAVGKGDALPFFDVATIDGGRARYADFWQRRNLLLVCLPVAATAADVEYARQLSGHSAAFDEYAAACVVTRDPVARIPSPGVVIADRWGEVQYLTSPATIRDLPDVRELLDTLDYVQRRCPECEGEWR